LVGCGAGIALSSLSGLQSFAYLPDNPEKQNEDKDIVVIIFLRGGCDALNLVAPVGDRFYADARGKGMRVDENGLDLKNGLDGFDFRLHPKAKALKEIYNSGELGIIHACGLPNGTRSHFDAMSMIERGIIQKQGGHEGWLARYLRYNEPSGELPAIACGNSLPDSFLGSNIAASISELKEFNLHTDPRIFGILRNLYKGDSPLSSAAQTTLRTIKAIDEKLPKKSNGKVEDYHPEVDYPMDWSIRGFSESLQTLAQLIKMDMGVHVANVDFGGWDTHDGQPYVFPRLVEGLSNTVAAFYNDLHHYHKRLTVVVMSEFGRRLKSNKSNGTDHGHGGVAMVLGGNVKGGQMYGSWPGLATDQLDNGVDLKVTTDYRTILSELLQKQLKAQDLDKIFPGFEGYKPLGFI